jgi:hypothetical protein
MAYQRGGYWYRSKREGNRVVTEYLGNRSWVQAAARLDALDQERRTLERAERQAEREAELELDREIDALGNQVRLLTQAILLVSGYHTHKRQWRKRRDDRGHDSAKAG